MALTAAEIAVVVPVEDWPTIAARLEANVPERWAPDWPPEDPSQVA